MANNTSATTRFEKVFLSLIVLLGSFLRLYKIRGYMTFLGDEGRDVLVVLKMLTEFDIPFIGPTASVGGFFLGPIYYYFMAPFLALFRLDPVGPAVMVALFGIVTILLLYKVGKDFFNIQTGIIAALLYSVSPLVIAHSRSSWNPNIVPFFSLLYIYALWKATKTNNKWWYAIFGASFGIGIQLHYLFAFLFPVGLVYLLFYGKIKKNIGRYWYTAGGALLFLFPFLGFEIKNRFPNTHSIINYVLQNDEVSYSGSVLSVLQDVIFRLFARLIFYFPPTEQLYLYNQKLLSSWNFIIVSSIVISFGYLIYQAVRFKQSKDVLLLLWAVFGIGLFSFYNREIYDYYFVIKFALPFLLIASMLGTLWNIAKLKLVVIVMVGFLFVLNWEGQPFRYPPNNQVTQVSNIARVVYDAAGDKPYNFALITGGNSDHAYRYFLKLWGRKPVVIKNEVIDPDRTSVTDQLLVICEGVCQPIGHSLWEIAGFGRAQIDQVWQLEFVTVYKLVHFEDEVVQ